MNLFQNQLKKIIFRLFREKTTTTTNTHKKPIQYRNVQQCNNDNNRDRLTSTHIYKNIYMFITKQPSKMKKKNTKKKTESE